MHDQIQLLLHRGFSYVCSFIGKCQWQWGGERGVPGGVTMT